MICIVTVLGIALLAAGAATLYENRDISRILVLSFVGYLFTYILNSAVLFYIDRFSVLWTCTLVLIEALVLLVALLLLGKRPTFSFQVLECVIPLLIFLIFLPVVFQKFGFFGMGQDQGVYQVKALALIEGYNSNEYELEETRNLNDDQIQAFHIGIQEQYGFYYTPDNGDITKGVFHGINTYPAVLAWWGSIFGYSHMAGVDTLLLLCGIFLIYDVAGFFLRTRVGATAVTFLYAVSPMILWINKSTLSEAVTNVVFLSFLYLLFEPGRERYKWLSAIPVVVFAVLHVSIYVMMPMFVVVYIVMYLLSGNKQFLVANIIAVIGYRLGYHFMMHIAAGYTEGNYAFIQRLGIKVEQMPMAATFVVGVAIVISLLLMLVPVKKRSKQTIFEIHWIQFVISWGARLLIVGSAYIAYRVIHYSVFSYVNATMYAYVSATAVVVIPFILLLVFVRARLIFRDLRLVPLYFIFLYCVILYAAVFSPCVSYYNYYSRYISVYLCCALLFGACLLEQVVAKKYTKILPYLYGAVVLFAVVLYGKYDCFMIRNQDETMSQWSAVAEVTQHLTSSDALIIDGNLKNQLLYTTKIISKNKAYPIMDSLEDTILIAKEKADGVYYASCNQLNESDKEKYKMELVSVIDNSQSIYDKDRVNLGRLPYVTVTNIEQQPIYLYRSISES